MYVGESGRQKDGRILLKCVNKVGEWHWTEEKETECSRLLSSVMTVNCSTRHGASDINCVGETTGK
jgi:hypothetical protein